MSTVSNEKEIISEPVGSKLAECVHNSAVVMVPQAFSGSAADTQEHPGTALQRKAICSRLLGCRKGSFVKTATSMSW